VDFPAWRKDHEVYLCWKSVKIAIGFWHELDAGSGVVDRSLILIKKNRN